MALTKISTDGVKNDAISAGKIPANAIGSSEIADDAVDQGAIADEAVDEARLQISNAGSNGQFLQKQSGNTGGLTWASANQYTHPNHSGEVTSTADGAQVIASNVVDEDNLKVSNSPTNGQLLSAQSGNTGGLTWTDPPASAPQLEATADGAIVAGKPCIITAAGKVKQVANTTSGSNSLVWNTGSAANLGSTISPAAGYYNTVAYDDDSDLIALAYKDGSDLKVKLYSTSGNGLASVATITAVSSLINTTQFTICKLSSRRFAIPYWNFAYGGNGRMEIVILTVNSNADGGSVGSAYSLDGTNNFSFYNEPHAVEIGTNRVAVLAKAHNTSCQVPNGKMCLIVGDITNDDEWTYRSNAQITSDTSDGQYRSIDYDSTDGIVGVAFTNNSNEVKFVGCKVAAGTGAAITQGTATDITTGGNKPNIKWHSNSGSWITACQHAEGSPTVTSLRVQAHTINSSTLAITSGTAINNTTQGYPAYMVDICISNQHLIYFNYINASKKLYSLSATVSGTTLTLNTSDITEQLTDHSGGMEKVAAEFMAHNDKIVMFATISGNYTSGTGNTTSVTSNLTTENYIGIANTSVSNNATATIDVSGATNSSQSSLTAGQKYYVQQDGTLGLTEDTTKVFAGTAVAATKLIVNDQQPIPEEAAVMGYDLWCVDATFPSSGHYREWDYEQAWGSAQTFTSDGGSGANSGGPGPATMSISRCTTSQNPLFAKVGDGMTMAAGVWTFPNTGQWRVVFCPNVSEKNTSGGGHNLHIWTTSNNGTSWHEAIKRRNRSHDSTWAPVSFSQTELRVNITDTSNQKVKFAMGGGDGRSKVWGATDKIESHFIFEQIA